MALELITGGESHGPEMVTVLSGLPAGLRLDRDAIDGELARRQHGYGRGGRQKIERDRVEVRAGLHTGECEVRGDDIGGIAVHIGARVAALAGPNDVLVSSTLPEGATRAP